MNTYNVEDIKILTRKMSEEKPEINDELKKIID